MAKEPKQMSVISIPLLHVESWQADNILKRMELGRKIYNSMLSKNIKKMHVMERTQAWRDNQRQINDVYENNNRLNKDLESAKKSAKEASTKKKKTGLQEKEKEIKKKIKDNKDSLKALYEEKNRILQEYGFTEFAFTSQVADFNFSPENVSSNMAALSIAAPQWAAFKSRYYPQKLSKEGDLPVPSFKKYNDFFSLMSNGKSGMRLIERDGRLYLSLSNQRYTKKKVEIPIEYKDLNLYEKEALSRNLKILTLQATPVKNKIAFSLNVTYEGAPPLKYTKDGELKHVFNQKGTVGIAIWRDVLCAVSDKEYYITSLNTPDHVLNETKIADINREIDKLKRLRDFQNFDENGAIKKGIIGPNGKRQRLKWHPSKRMLELTRQKREIFRIERENKELLHWQIVNHLMSMGNEFRIAETTFNTQKPEFDEDDRLTNVEYRKKKERRKAIQASAPYSLLTKLSNKAKAHFGTDIEKINIPENEYWYTHEFNTAREEALSNLLVVVEGECLLQTAYRAFLIRHRENGVYCLPDIQKDFPNFVAHYKEKQGRQNYQRREGRREKRSQR